MGRDLWCKIFGSIKALTTALMVFSTAFGTAIFGLLIDKGFTIEHIAFVSVTYISLSLLALLLIKRSIEPIIFTKKT